MKSLLRTPVSLVALCLTLVSTQSHGMMREQIREDLQNDFKLELPEVRKKIKVGRIDGFYFTEHVVERMKRRGISNEDILNTVRHGDRYNSHRDDDGKMCVDTETGIVVILNDTTNTIITAYANMHDAKLQKWLENREIARQEMFPQKKKPAKSKQPEKIAGPLDEWHDLFGSNPTFMLTSSVEPEGEEIGLIRKAEQKCLLPLIEPEPNQKLSKRARARAYKAEIESAREALSTNFPLLASYEDDASWDNVFDEQGNQVSFERTDDQSFGNLMDDLDIKYANERVRIQAEKKALLKAKQTANKRAKKAAKKAMAAVAKQTAAVKK